MTVFLKYFFINKKKSVQVFSLIFTYEPKEV